jgi:hypothetical protein
MFARQSTPATPVSIVVTLEPKHGKTIPPIEQQDFTVSEAGAKRPVTSLTPLPLRQGSTQLMLLIDDSARGTFDTEVNTLKQFVNGLPPNVEVAVAYMRNGMASYTCKFTGDHAAAAHSIRISFGPGGADVSPYDSLSDAAKHWPQPGAQRKVVIMISSGIEALGGGFAPDNPYVNAGISSAQKIGLTVYSIYSPSVGHLGHSFWRANWGQNFLSQLSDETGGEMYAIGFGSPVSFQPFLDEILQQLQHQFVLTFDARPEAKAGLQPINVKITEKDASIAAPDKVFIPASQ